MTETLLLSDLLTRRLSLHWHEGVAIVRGVTAQLLEQDGTALRVPELHQIALAADGSLAIRGGLPANEPVRRLGQLLQATLTDTDGPVKLRLIISQATAPIPSYASLGELDQALAYFERPDRDGLLTAVFARAQAAGPAAGGAPAVTLDRLAPLPEGTATRATAARNGSRRLPGRAIAGIAVLVFASAAAMYVWRTGLKVDERTTARATAVGDAMGAAVLSGASALSDSVGLGRIVAADAATAATPAAGPPAAPGPSAKKNRRVVADIEISAPAPEGMPPTVVAYEPPDDPERLTDAPGRQTGTTDSWPDAPIDAVIYNTGAVGVSPPLAVGAQVPRQLPPTIDPGNLVRIELIIARDGSVESARLLSPRRHVLGGMFLSAAKTWEFHPATRDGVPVRFRKTILVSFE